MVSMDVEFRESEHLEDRRVEIEVKCGASRVVRRPQAVPSVGPSGNLWAPKIGDWAGTAVVAAVGHDFAGVGYW